MKNNRIIYMRYKCRKAFTLAETLIAITIIGVISVLVISPLIENVNETALNNQNKVFAAKFEQGLQMMRLKNKLVNNYDTASFVEEMKNHFEIVKVCDSDNLSGCFAAAIKSYEKDKGEKVYNVSEMKTANKLSYKYENSPVYGLKFVDGTSMLLSYIPGCTGVGSDDFSGDTKKCLLYLYDVNSNKSPNTYGGATAGFYDKNNNTLNKGKDIIGNISLGGNMFNLSFNLAEIANRMTWSNAEKYCKALDKDMPDVAKAKEMAEKIFVESGYCTYREKSSGGGDRYNCTEEVRTNPLWIKLMEKSNSSGGNIDAFYFWTNKEEKNNAVDCIIGQSTKGYYWWGCYSNPKSTKIVNVMCVE